MGGGGGEVQRGCGIKSFSDSIFVSTRKKLEKTSRSKATFDAVKIFLYIPSLV